jgi:hypothetical protein
MGLSRRKRGAFLSTCGILSSEKFQERVFRTLVNKNAMLLASILGKMADKTESA